MVARDLRNKKHLQKSVTSKIQVRPKLHFKTDVFPHIVSLGIIMLCRKFASCEEGKKKTTFIMSGKYTHLCQMTDFTLKTHFVAWHQLHLNNSLTVTGDILHMDRLRKTVAGAGNSEIPGLPVQSRSET